MITVNALSLYIPVNHNILLFVNLINFSNPFAKPILYSLRISEFRKALFSTARKMSLTNGRGSWVVGVGVGAGVGAESITMINMNIIFISHI